MVPVDPARKSAWPTLWRGDWLIDELLRLNEETHIRVQLARSCSTSQDDLVSRSLAHPGSRSMRAHPQTGPATPPLLENPIRNCGVVAGVFDSRCG